MKIVTVHQMKDVDNRMIKEHGVTPMALMEKAGAGVATLILSLLDRYSWPRKVLFFAGKGNNGGDAFVAARLLEEKQVKTQVFLLGSVDEVKGTAKESLKKLKSRGFATITEIKSKEDLNRIVEAESPDVIAVDAIVGTGAKGPLQGLFSEAVEWINKKKFLATLAIDIPSGLNPDDGSSEGPAVRADYTLTMGLPKRGLMLHEGLECTGVLNVVDLDIPDSLIKEIETHEFFLTPKNLVLPPRRLRMSHKGVYGHLLIIGGSPGLTGAPCLASWAALRTGAGLVTVGIGESLNSILEIKLTEPMTLPLPEAKPGYLGPQAVLPVINFLSRVSAVVLGPGLSTYDATQEFIYQLLPHIKVPLVIDADGLNALAKRKDILKNIHCPVILTPHPGEMARLMGKSSKEIQSQRWDLARNASREWNAITVLKGAGTVIATPEGALFVNTTGNPGMAVGGMGDLLSGMIGGFIVQGMDTLDAAKLGVYLHGVCGDAVTNQGCDQGMLASDLLEFIPKELKKLQSAARG